MTLIPILLLGVGAGLVSPPGNAVPAPPAEVQLGRLKTPPSVDGVVTDAEWEGAARVSLAFQTQPGDNVPASEATEVYLAYDARNLYLAFRARDKDASAIRARVGRREEVFSDDYVGVYLDTFDDRRRAYVFDFNALGVQADGLYEEGRAIGRDFDKNIDRAWDGVLESKGAIDVEGYVVEAAIPFSTLRFQPGQEQRWGLQLRRFIARKAESVYWRPISRDVSGLLSQMGSLQGLRDISGGPRLELIPTLVASVTNERQPQGRYSDDREAQPGLTAAWSVTPNLTLSGAANPDFSQVEADTPQIAVNQRFPLFYPDKRPFFLEGKQVFASAGALGFLDTRQIVDPDWGVKLTGKAGRATLGFLSAADRAPGLRVEPESPGSGDKAYLNVGRYQRDLGQSSTAGVFLSDWRFGSSSNTVLSGDGQLRLGQHIVGFQLSRALTTEPDGRSFSGSASYVWYELQGRHWRLFLSDQRVTDDYRNQAAFVRRTGIHVNSGNWGYEFQPKTSPSWFVKARPFVVWRYLRTTQGSTDESYVDPGLDITLPRDVSFYVYHSFHRDAFAGREFDYQFNVIYADVFRWKPVTLSGRFEFGEGVNYDLARPEVGAHVQAGVTLTLKPSEALSNEFIYLLSRLEAKDTGETLFEQQIFRDKLNYQVTRSHALRLIGEYDSFTRRLDVSFLYSFTPRTNTAVYLGYGDQQFSDVDPLDERPRPGWNRLRRTLFVKLSYGYRR